MGFQQQQIENRLAFEGEELERFNALMDKIYGGTFMLSPSSLRQFLLSPRHFVRYKVVKEELSDSAKLGILVEELVLNEGVTRFKILDTEQRPELDKTMASNANKAWKAEFIEAAGGESNLVSETIYDKAKKMAASVLADPMAMEIISAATEIQKRIEWEYMGVKYLGFIDIDNPKLITDFKTCPDCHVSKFKWKLQDKDSQYGVQLKSYQIGDGTNKDCAIIAVDGDCNTSVFDISYRSLDYAEQEIKRGTDGFLRCMEENRWHESYSFWSPNGRFTI